MGLHSPLPQSLAEECQKCAQIIREFTADGEGSLAPDQRIPPGVLERCCGVAVITVFRMGFLVTMRGGTGLVVARLEDGSWSAPSAIALGGLGGGFEIGLEVTDFVIVMNSRRALESFCKGGNVTLGGNFAVSAGPLGRTYEGDVAVRSISAFFTYSKSFGLYAGISLVGSALIERKGANAKMYHNEVRARDLLKGLVDQPNDAVCLYSALDEGSTKPGDTPRYVAYSAPVVSQASSASRAPPPKRSSSSTVKEQPKPKVERSWTSSMSSKFASSSSKPVKTTQSIAYEKTAASFAADQKRMRAQAASMAVKDSGGKVETKQSRAAARVQKLEEEAEKEWSSDPTGKALYSFNGEMECDLSFKEGDVITILTRTATQDDWWEGRLNGRVGIFPANYIKLL